MFRLFNMLGLTWSNFLIWPTTIFSSSTTQLASDYKVRKSTIILLDLIDIFLILLVDYGCKPLGKSKSPIVNENLEPYPGKLSILNGHYPFN